MDIQQRQLVNKYLDLFSRQKVFIITMLLLSLPVGLGVYLRTPKVYQSSSLVSYEPQKISPNKQSPDVESRVGDIVSTLSQIVTSRTNLEEIIKDNDLYPELRKKIPIEDVIGILRKKIVIQPSDRGDVFTISYSGNNPGDVVRVTNAIAAKFIEENLKYRHDRATETSTYTNQELQMAKKVMDAKENDMRDYKLKYYNEMPEHREMNMASLASLREQYQGKQDSIQDLERTLVLIRDQMNNQKMLAQRAPAYATDGNQPNVVEETSEQRLARLRSTLDSLLLKYTEKHPEIKRVRKLIEKLEVEIRSGSTSGKGLAKLSQSSSTGSSQGRRLARQNSSNLQTMMQLESQRKDIERNIVNIESEKNQLREKIEQYEKWLAVSPVREAEWSSLTREYDQLKKHYDYLVAQNLEAESMLNLEIRQKGSQFKIEDPGQFSGKPIKPNFFIIMGFSVLAGLGVGLGGVLALDVFDSSFRDAETIEPFLGIPLLTTIPYIEIEAEQKRQKWQRILLLSLLLAAIALITTLFVFFWMRGDIIF
ncbi:hypothetical protein FCL47_16930 [Desulfopila sp. IMCC35006]|uniref:hypothetical protein n=1 Tax=Desulfopila sp. IMCC35006 TaxID=2569542 RepID=UPI0010AD5237|nr:hypothetical protein [Desulfopila sp. IMCC35006]TKB24925.1 hypothetical protein FCL47_16930 [Desulfopila sp. IMCC35006]